ncbi:MAG: hypothetical protein L0099_07345 [Acidobacteria bacterium]|nr:hypothetical protein [Acidobacteriota bacterium]
MVKFLFNFFCYVGTGVFMLVVILDFLFPICVFGSLWALAWAANRLSPDPSPGPPRPPQLGAPVVGKPPRHVPGLSYIKEGPAAAPNRVDTRPGMHPTTFGRG